jgi:hypothetical protein
MARAKVLKMKKAHIVPISSGNKKIDWSSLHSEPLKSQPGRKCEISDYLPGIVCNEPAKYLWGYGSIIDVCEFHYQLDPSEGTKDLLAQLAELTTARN